MAVPNLLTAWPSIQERVSTASKILLGLDFDGTLSPIALRPDLAKLPRETKQALVKIAASSKAEVAIVSGRGIKDLAAKVELAGLTYVGNHGLEIWRPTGNWKHPDAEEARRIMNGIREELEPKAAGIPGAQVEPKGSTLSVHYRRVKNPRKVQELKEAVDGVARPYIERGTVRRTSGELVLELRPSVPWGKGHALGFLLGRVEPGDGAEPSELIGAVFDGTLPVYIGDDETDEDGFRAIESIGIPVRVGRPGKPTAARYLLDSPGEVRELLERLAATLLS